MLTFEKVLSAFKYYLSEDTRYEVLVSSRGHTVMEWDDKTQNWEGATLCRTPEELKNTLLDVYADYLGYQTTLGHRGMTDEEQRTIKAQVDAMDERVQ